MAETLSEKQERITVELQQLLVEAYPALDFSVGTVMYDLLIKPAALTFANQDVELDTLRDNLSLSLVLAQDEPDAAYVDSLLSNYNVTRTQGEQATGVINVYTTSTQNVYVSATNLITCDGVNLNPVKAYVGVAGTIAELDTDDIAYVQMRDVGDGLKVFSITAQTVEVAATVLSAGLLCTEDIGDPSITRVETGSSFTGGSVEETSAQLLERARTGVNARVITGRDNIRGLLQNQTIVNVVDSQVFGMGDELQLRDAANNGGVSAGGRVDVYARTTTVPTLTDVVLAGVLDAEGYWTVEVPQDAYAGAYGVTQLVYDNDLINTSLEHILGYDPVGPWPLIESTLHARYSKYQTLSIRFQTTAVADGVTEANFVARVIHMPGIAALQDSLNDDGIRSMAFDHVVKGVIPVIMEIDVDIEYPRGIVPPSAGEVQQSISDVINRKYVGVEALYTSDVAYACRLLFPEGIPRMPVNLRAAVYLPDGSIAFTSSQNYIKIRSEPGISFANCQFFCYPSDVNVKLTEVAR